MILGLGLVRLCVTLQRKEAELYVSLWDFVFLAFKNIQVLLSILSASVQARTFICILLTLSLGSPICLTSPFNSVSLWAEVATGRFQHVLGRKAKSQGHYCGLYCLRHSELGRVLMVPVGYNLRSVQLLILCLVGSGMGSYSIFLGVTG